MSVRFDLNSQRGDMAKDMGSFASSSSTKSKKKPIKKRRDVLMKKIVEAKERYTTHATDVVSSGEARNSQEGDTCKKFILVDDLNPMNFTTLNVQVQTPPSENLPDVNQPLYS